MLPRPYSVLGGSTQGSPKAFPKDCCLFVFVCLFVYLFVYLLVLLKLICGLSAENNGSIESLNVKEWQDGLRALLPNININFGGLPSSTSSSSSSSSSSSVNHIGGPGGSLGGVSHSLSWDATASWMDPAIITGPYRGGLMEPLCCRRRAQSVLGHSSKSCAVSTVSLLLALALCRQ